MSRQVRKSGARRDRTNLYSEITDKIIAEPEAGRVADWILAFLLDADSSTVEAGTVDRRAA